MEYTLKLEKETKKASRSFLKGVFYTILLVGAFGAGMYLPGKSLVFDDLARQEVVYVGKLTGKYSEPTPGKISQDLDFKMFWDVWDVLRTKHADGDKSTDKQMFYGALEGLTASLGDPYTMFMSPSDTKSFMDDLSGTFEGIGAQIGIKDDILIIIAPLEDMPAQKAGLKASDKIIAINDEITAGISVDEAVRKIRGPKDTTVKLTILRDGLREPRDFEITRGVIQVKSVKTEMRDDEIFVVKITNFNGDTEGLFNKAVNEIIQKQPSGIILDLRNNPGGYLDTAISMASKWIENGIVVSEKFGTGEQSNLYSFGPTKLKDFKTVVLVNEGSASASEIVAGALQDHKKAILVGKQTFGKGSVQTMDNLSDGSSLKITIAKWLTPNGKNINEEGIAPDETVEITQEQWDAGEDPQMDKAVDLIMKNE